MAKTINDVVLGYLNGTYTSDNGRTEFRGQSLSYVLDELRGLGVPSNRVDAELALEVRGFRVLRGRGQRAYRGGKVGWGNWGRVVTV